MLRIELSAGCFDEELKDDRNIVQHNSNVLGVNLIQRTHNLSKAVHKNRMNLLLEGKELVVKMTVHLNRPVGSLDQLVQHLREELGEESLCHAKCLNQSIYDWHSDLSLGLWIFEDVKQEGSVLLEALNDLLALS